MIDQTNIPSIFPAPTLWDAPLIGNISGLGDSRFQEFMKDAVQDSSYARDDNVAARKELQDPPPESEPNRVEPRENSPAQEVNPSQRPSEDQKASASETETKIVEQLQDLNISPEKIEALLALLNVESGAGPSAQQQRLYSLLKDQGGEAVDLLVKAGLTEQEAKNLLTKIQPAQVNQASLQSAEETADDVPVKLNGERGALGKDDFPYRFSDLDKQGEPPRRRASIEKVLTQAAGEPAADLNQKPLAKAAAAQKLEGSFQPGDGQVSPVATQNPANPFNKGSEGLKAPPEVKVQSVNFVPDSAAKASDSVKPISSGILGAKGTTEAKVVNQILNKFSLRVNGSQGDIKIKLDPPSLGTIRMNVSTSGESVRTVVIAESHAVKQIIENNLTQLRDSMGMQGLKVDSFTVLVGGGEDQAGRQNTPHEGRSHYAGQHGENNAAPETLADNSVQGAPRLIFNDSRSISVFA